MGEGWIQAAGGLGLFLLGMVILTEGLRGIAGDSLQRTLRRFTRSPTSGAVTGMCVTALIQSSSATTVTAVGFAGAGLLTFTQALGIVFGANIGTTITGWLVALVGFKLNLSAAMPPVILLGVLLRLFGRGRTAQAGYALAGFGLVFVGIDLLRAGMSGLEGVVALERFPGETVLGRLQLVGIGALVTLVTQSSSAGVAMALTAVNADSISFAQAGALVIGMDVGTTVTAAVAAAGGTLAARRTGWAHVLYNLLTGLGAFLLLPIYVWALDAWSPGATADEPEIALVAFHTLFNTLGVLTVVPMADRFARLLERLVPERPVPFTQRLDRSLLRDPHTALRAVAPTLGELALQSFDLIRELLTGRIRRADPERLGMLELALDETRTYLSRIATPPRGGAADAREVAALHLIDRLRRLLERAGQAARAATVTRDEELRVRAQSLAEALPSPLGDPGRSEAALSALATELANERDGFRSGVLRRASVDAITSEEAISRMDAWRWLERIAHHAWRVVHHARKLTEERPSEPEEEPHELEEP